MSWPPGSALHLLRESALIGRLEGAAEARDKLCTLLDTAFIVALCLESHSRTVSAASAAFTAPMCEPSLCNRTLSRLPICPKRTIPKARAIICEFALPPTTGARAMGLTKDFMDDPFTFLERYAVVEISEAQMTAAWRPAPYKFILALKFANGGNVVELRKAMGNPAEAIDAYWLPWKAMEATCMDLPNDGAEFLFTSGMTNCRFSVLTNNGTTKVAHVAGTLNSGQRRDGAEIKAGFCTEDTRPRARRLSIAGSKVSDSPHLYTGQGKDFDSSSSAFVFGRRQDNEWSFYCQIVNGVMSAGTFLNRDTAPKNVDILDSHRRI